MQRFPYTIVPLLLALTGAFPADCAADSGSDKAASFSLDAVAEAVKPQRARGSAGHSVSGLSRIGIAVKASTLGIGGDVAARVTDRSNVRAGFNVFSFSRGFSKDGIDYSGQLQFRSFETHFDWFLFGGFHLSPGLMFYNGNQIKAGASVPGGKRFSLGPTTYTSDARNPASANGKIDFTKVAPTFLVGFGNLIPRGHRHFSVPFEVGVVFSGAPKASMSMSGSVCDRNGRNCVNPASDPIVQSDMRAEEKKINDGLSPLTVYPVVSLGFSYRF